MRSCIAGAGAAAALLLAAPGAIAAGSTGIALDRLDPAPAGDTFVGVPSPFARGNLVPRGLVMFDSASQPLRLEQPSGTAGVVTQQAFLHINASFAVQDRLLISALLPVALIQGGDDPAVRGVTLMSPSSAQIGDLRLGARVRMFGDDDDPFQLGVGLNIHLPTGKAGSFVGEGSVRAAPHLAAGGRFSLGVPFVWSAFGGAMVRSSVNPSLLTYGAGLAVALLDDRLQLGPEIYAATPLQEGTFQLTDAVKIPSKISTSAELLVGARARLFGGLSIGLAAGPGIGQAIGTPSFRFAGSLGWAPGGPSRAKEGPIDADGDGLLDAADACPYAAGPKSEDPKKSGCPVLDDDEDGIPNGDDACPDKYGPKSADAKTNGCPPPKPVDSDADGIPDGEDACPNELGGPSFDKAKNGCPAPIVAPDPDSDHDGVPDADDACPHEKGDRSADTKTTGCPKLVRVSGAEIALLAPVEFKVAKGAVPPIDPSSEALLADVASVIVQHPEFVKIEVGAHTDNKGNARFNEKVSAGRAEAVRAWLAAHGVPADKLVAKGYGDTKPIGDNKTAEGRAKNKRITILVLEKKQQP
jgi:OmpA-OmpF porin, OOP family